MSFLSPPKLPPPAPLPPPPPAPAAPGEQEAPEIEAAKAEERERQDKRKGRRSTILTGPQGVTGLASVQRTALLGQ